MRLDEIYGSAINGVDPELLAGVRKSRSEADNARSGPSSWGSDSVTISPEARAAAEAQVEAQKKDSSQEEPGTAEEFAAYMDKARGRTGGGGGGSEDQLTNLKNKLKELQNQLVQMAADPNPKPGHSQKIDNLISQIESVSTQIAELEAQLAEESAGE